MPDGLVTVRNVRVLVETVQAVEQGIFERDITTVESLDIIQTISIYSVFERQHTFFHSPAFRMTEPVEIEFQAETVALADFHQPLFVDEPLHECGIELTVYLPVRLDTAV